MMVTRRVVLRGMMGAVAAVVGGVAVAEEGAARRYVVGISGMV